MTTRGQWIAGELVLAVLLLALLLALHACVTIVEQRDRPQLATPTMGERETIIERFPAAPVYRQPGS